MKKIPILFAMLLFFSSAIIAVAQVAGTFKDPRDGKVYKTVKIGNQTWMAENLAYKAGSGCWAYNNDQGNVATYGYLYNWETAKQVCPTGWHLPSDAEWKQLTTYLGGKDVAGGKLKEAGTAHWESPNEGATNESGFTAIPAGTRKSGGTFGSIGSSGYWWGSSEIYPFDACYRVLHCNLSSVFRYYGYMNYGFSGRCLRD